MRAHTEAKEVRQSSLGHGEAAEGKQTLALRGTESPPGPGRVDRGWW